MPPLWLCPLDVVPLEPGDEEKHCLPLVLPLPPRQTLTPFPRGAPQVISRLNGDLALQDDMQADYDLNATAWPGATSRRRDCPSAAPPSAFSRCFNSDGERASAE